MSAGSIKVFNNKGILVKIQTPNGIVGNEAGNLESETLDASANGSATSSSRQAQMGGFPIVLVGVIIVAAVTAITLAVGNNVILDSNTNISASPIR